MRDQEFHKGANGLQSLSIDPLFRLSYNVEVRAMCI